MACARDQVICVFVGGVRKASGCRGRGGSDRSGLLTEQGKLTSKTVDLDRCQ